MLESIEVIFLHILSILSLHISSINLSNKLVNGYLSDINSHPTITKCHFYRL